VLETEPNFEVVVSYRKLPDGEMKNVTIKDGMYYSSDKLVP